MIELKNLTKKFGDFYAVDHLNLKVETGEFLGLLGANGAGKTTTISMICTVLLPTEGEVIIDGEKLDRRASDVKRKLSVIHLSVGIFPYLNACGLFVYSGVCGIGEL